MPQQRLFSNLAKATLAGAITNTATSIQLQSGQGALFPSPGTGQYFAATLADAATGLIVEIVHCTNVTGDVLTVVRGQEGTTANAYNAGDACQIRITAADLAAFSQGGNQIASYNGNPNGFVAGTAGTAGGVSPDFLWDTVNNIWWVCTTSGDAASAVWYGASAQPSGQCYLSMSGSNLLLLPKNGNKVPVNGALETIPAAGVSLAPTGLTASTLYYIYAEMVGGVITLLASTTGHSTDAATGVEVMTGDATKTLVGMGYVNAAGAWSLVLSWFNRQDVWLGTSSGLSGTITTSSAVQISIIDVPFLCWAGHAVELCPLLAHQTSTAGFAVGLFSYIDGANVGEAQAISTSFVGQTITTQATNYAYPTEGYHVAQVWANTNSGQSITLVSGAQLVKAEG